MTEIMGYPTKTAAVLAMRAEGMRISDVARKLGISQSAASGLESHAKRVKSINREAPSAARRASEFIPLDVRVALRPHAAKRNVSTERLIIDLVIAVAENDLVDAVLDDGVAA